MIFAVLLHKTIQELTLLILGKRSAWTFNTSGGGGFNIDVIAASAGEIILNNPVGQNVKFHFGAIGAGLSVQSVQA